MTMKRMGVSALVLALLLGGWGTAFGGIISPVLSGVLVPATNDDGATARCGWSESGADWKITAGDADVGESGDLSAYWQGLLCAETLNAAYCQANKTGFWTQAGQPYFDAVICCAGVSQGLESTTNPVDWETGNATVGTGPGYIDPDTCGDPVFLVIRHQPLTTGLLNSWVAYAELAVTNTPPVANPDFYTMSEDSVLTVGAPGILNNDFDADGDPLTALYDGLGPTHGIAMVNPDGSIQYTPDENWCGIDSFQYNAFDGEEASELATVEITVDCVDDPPVITSVTPGAGTVDYSDYIEQVTIVARDVDSDILQLRYSCLGGGWTCRPLDLPDVTTLNTTEACTLLPDLGDGPGAECTYTLDGRVTEPGFEQWDIGFMAVDEYEPYTRLVKCLPAYVGEGKPYSDLSDCQYNLTVHPEDATVRLDDGNQVAIEVDEDDGLSGPFDLHFIAWETNDNSEDEGSPQFGDNPDYSEAGTACGNGSPDCVDHGYLGNAEVFMDLVPVGPGGRVSGTCSMEFDPAEPYSDYDQILMAHCDFEDVPVNTYVVEARVGEGFEEPDTYFFGMDEDAFTVFDPNAGFTTGGGYLYWPNTERPLGSKWEYFGNLIPDPCTVYYYYLLGYEEGYPGDKTNFGWTMKYNKKGTNLQGNALVVRHVMEPRLFLGFIPYCADVGKFRIKSNALDYLVIGESPEGTDPAFGFTIFSGKATYREPGWEENVGNHKFFIYAEDYGDQGCGQDPSDRFWLEVQDKDGNIVWQPQMGSDPVIAAENIQCGNIVVPHGGGDKGGKGEGKPDK